MKQLILLLTIVPCFSIAQVGIGTSSPLGSAQLEVASTTRGFLPPRMTTAQRNLISSPAQGLIIFNTSTNSLDVYSGAVWISFGMGLGAQSTNQALGYSVLASNTTGDENVGVGYQALSLNTTGFRNTTTGSRSMYNNTIGKYNTASGYYSLYNTTTGGNNVGIGFNALYNNTTGSNNTAIGSSAGVSSGGLTNATAIGANATVSANNTIRLGNTDVTNVSTSGTITAGTITYPNTSGTSGYYLTTDGTNTASWAALQGSSFVGRGVDVTFGDLKVRVAGTGLISLQISTVTGNSFYLFGSCTKVVSGIVGASRIDPAAALYVNGTPTYLNANDNLPSNGDTSTWLIMSPSLLAAWRISMIVNLANQYFITIEKLK